jgi:hypothetical protein
VLVTADPDRVAPTEFVHFSKVLGSAGEMRVGDEFWCACRDRGTAPSG